MSQPEPAFALDYWKIAGAVNRALHDLEDELDLSHEQIFWRVCNELTEAYPQFDWKNTLTDQWPRRAT